MKGLITKNISDSYEVWLNGSIITAKPRGKLKKSDKLLVGDYVECNCIGNEYIIEGRMQRKNQFVRPSIANIDILCILVTEIPIADKYLVDKLIIKCFENKIKPILVISKKDIVSDKFVEEIESEYYFLDIFKVSALTNESIGELKTAIKGKLTALAGQSAVGKSKLSSALGALAIEGEISKKTLRGKHTTRHTEIYILKDDILLADTPGFSRLDINEIRYTDLKYYYPEFENAKCKYASCDHIEQKVSDCFVKMALNDCKINQNRYNRYVELYKDLKQYWETRYD